MYIVCRADTFNYTNGARDMWLSTDVMALLLHRNTGWNNLKILEVWTEK